MAETLTVASHEHTAGALQAYNELTSPDGLQAFQQRIADEVRGFNYEGVLGDISQAEERLQGKLRDLRAQAETDEPLYYDQQLKDFTHRLNELDDRERAAKRVHAFQTDRQFNFDRHGALTYDSSEAEAGQFIAQLLTNSSKEDHGFIYDDEFKYAVDEAQPQIIIESRGEPILFPLTAFVSATGMDSWELGRQHGVQRADSSADLIREYAERPTDIPPVEAQALLLETGEVVLKSENAHRAAAAKLKGQATLGVRSLTVYRARPDFHI
jgi:hypothetical protein